MERVQQAEGQLVVVPATVDRLLRDVRQGVVHPAHVPLEAEAQPAHVRRPRHLRPGRRLFGDGQHAGTLGVHDLIHALQEGDRFQVFPATVLIRDPLAGLA